MNNKALIYIGFLAFTAGCSSEQPVSDAERVERIGSVFVHAYFNHYPEEVYESGYPDAPMDRWGDHSQEQTIAWDARIDGWLSELDAIDVASLSGTPSALTYAFARERLQSLVDRRVCKMELWNISPTWTGWQYMFSGTLAIQPVDTAEERQAALARARDIDRFLSTEIDNLRLGQDMGYLAPQSNVDELIDQVTRLAETKIQESPYFSPASRSDDDEFAADYAAVMRDVVTPALLRYRDFLRDEYTGHAEVGVARNPDGEACYDASVAFWSSVRMSAEDIHRMGLSEMARIQAEMLEIAQDSFGTDDVNGLLEELRTNPEYTFASEQEMLEYVTAAVERGKEAVNEWFGNVPEAELLIRPSPAYEQDSGGGFYTAGTVDGSRPGIYQVGTYSPTTISKAGPESTAFHESYPGHHLQSSIAMLNASLNPIFQYTYISGFGEGWALYTERLADEMGVYSSDVARMGMLSNEAYRAARLVVDPGMHVLGWTKQEAMDYMLANTTESARGVDSETARYAAVPGQATSYLVGSLEIQQMRRHAEQALGEDFDIKAFHDRLLENGNVTLPMMRDSIEIWIRQVQERD